MTEEVNDTLLRAMPLPRHGQDEDKDERGRVLVIGGSRPVPGALLLAGEGALRAGAGKLQLATAAGLATQIGIAIPEALVKSLPETEDGDILPDAAAGLVDMVARSDAVLIGPGMLDEAGAGAFAAALLRAPDGPTFVLDAGALCCLGGYAAEMRGRRGRVVVTPHAGEMVKLSGLSRDAVVADPAAVALRIAHELGAVVALKGAETVIAAPDGRSWIYRGGRVGLATSGSGDTLAGLVAGLAARGASPHEAALWGVYLHGEAGNRLGRTRGPVGFLARELLAEVPALMAEFTNGAAGAGVGADR
jgi:hydroxyethylthiazole kinase-like uncharacterized protein yjeF